MSHKNGSSKHNPADHPPDFCDYGVGIIEQRLDKMLAQTEGAKSGQETRAIHQMRVWSRRTRAALDVFAPCFAGKTTDEFSHLEQDVKVVTRALGAARDLDVMLETLHARGESLPIEQRAGVDSFLAHLRGQRADRQQAVTDAMRHLERRDLKQQVQHLADRQGYKAITLPPPAVAPPPAPETNAPETLAPLIAANAVSDALNGSVAPGVQEDDSPVGPQTASSLDTAAKPAARTRPARRTDKSNGEDTHG